MHCFSSLLLLLAVAFRFSGGCSIHKQKQCACLRRTSRPLNQHWWPVTLESALDPKKRNHIQLLGQKLVLFHDGSDYKCLEDLCSHQLAPLSEGRVISSRDDASRYRLLQCAYHGWEFNGAGSCERIPQLQQSITSSYTQASVKSYPTRLAADMVWADAESSHLADTTELPISPLH